jgi:dienelactone hydrolase
LRERTFDVECDGRRAPGVLWLPEDGGPHPLVLAGHGFTLHKRALFPSTLAEDLVARGFAVLAFDAPAHGRRRPSPDASAEEIGAAWQVHWREFGASQIAAECSLAIDELSALGEVDASRVGYWGLSLATQYGLGVLGAERRIIAAVLGLFGLADVGIRMRRYAPGVECPAFFILQEDDEIHAAARVEALYNLIASPEKELHRSAGKHVEVPEEVFEEAYAWLERRLAVN